MHRTSRRVPHLATRTGASRAHRSARPAVPTGTCPRPAASSPCGTSATCPSAGRAGSPSLVGLRPCAHMGFGGSERGILRRGGCLSGCRRSVMERKGGAWCGSRTACACGHGRKGVPMAGLCEADTDGATTRRLELRAFGHQQLAGPTSPCAGPAGRSNICRHDNLACSGCTWACPTRVKARLAPPHRSSGGPARLIYSLDHMERNHARVTAEDRCESEVAGSEHRPHENTSICGCTSRLLSPVGNRSHAPWYSRPRAANGGTWRTA